MPRLKCALASINYQITIFFGLTDRHHHPGR
jgi:hypothetical protein